ncbi:MAG: DEAD/DEAH box helicase [Candidatus Desulfofervidaceae bacterium]|nr:DEAD/DEAH box helicase [Candidatus Desulfofervidaceae bacterium]
MATMLSTKAIVKNKNSSIITVQVPHILHLLNYNKSKKNCFYYIIKTAGRRIKLSLEVETIVENGTTPCEPVSSHTSLEMGFSHFNPLQSRFVLEKLHIRDVNILSAWPTSAGKTVVAELLAEQSLNQGKKVIYACPLKSLAEEKIRRLKKLFPERRLEIFTGDYRNIENRVQKAASAELSVVTTELLDSASRRKGLSQALIANAGVVIVDEAHIIATERGPAVESALVKISQINPDIRLVLLSATIGNTKELGSWLAALNGKDTVVLESSWRPVEIEWHILKAPNHRSYWAWRNMAIKGTVQKIAEIVLNEPDSQVLAFVWTKPEGLLLKKDLQKLGISCLFHNASLELEDRLDYEEKFENRQIRVLISTTTLAWGRNTCARHVFILGDRRGPEKVPAWDIFQMGGRAGRTGLAPKGDVWWTAHDLKFVQSVLGKQPEIKSLLKDSRRLAFALVGEFPYKGKADFQTIKKWFLRTLAGKTCPPGAADLLLKEALRILKEDTKAVTEDFSLTRIGRTAKMFYLDPYEAKAIESTIKTAVNNIPDLQNQIKKDISIAIAILTSRIIGMKDFYVSKSEEDEINAYPALKSKVFPMVETGLIKQYSHFAAAIWTHRWLKEMETYLCMDKEARLRTKQPYPHYKIRNMIWDMDRIGAAAQFLATQMGFAELGDFLADASLAIRSGAPLEACDLLRVKGIGPARAMLLLKAGIKDREQLKEAIAAQDPKVHEALPQNVIEEALRS